MAASIEFVYIKNDEGKVIRREKSRISLFKSNGWKECLENGDEKPSKKKQPKE
jgi:hypothetical protein